VVLAFIGAMLLALPVPEFHTFAVEPFAAGTLLLVGHADPLFQAKK
jgi:hypothetical protein